MKKRYIIIGIVLLVIFSGCLQESPENKCTDSDNGTKYYVKGTVIANSGFSGTDFCYAGTNYLQEYFCHEDKSGGTQVYECRYDCEEGACKVEPLGLKGENNPGIK